MNEVIENIKEMESEVFRSSTQTHNEFATNIFEDNVLC